jgi:putative flavoprotein involved in K+ transport
MTQTLTSNSTIPDGAGNDDHGIALGWLSAFGAAVEAHDTARVTALLSADPWWRDMYALTWDLTGMHGSDDIADVLRTALPEVGMHDVALDDHYEVRRNEGGQIEAMYTFSTDVGIGRGVVRLVEEDGVWRAALISTLLDALKDHPFHTVTIDDVSLPQFNVAAEPGRRRSTAELAEERRNFTAAEPEVLIIGGGHSGMFLAAHLEKLGVPTLIVDRFARAGDCWRTRYSGLVLHDLKWAVQFPYSPYPDSWPVFLSKDYVADWLEQYVVSQELNLWTSTEAQRATYDDASGTWTVQVDRNGEKRVLHPKHLVIATGLNGLPKMPTIEGMDSFGGQIFHSSDYVGGAIAEGKRVVVVGAGSSGHDVAQDAYENSAAAVTMVQRSPTYVYSQTRALPIQFGTYYSHDHMPIEDADLLASTAPTALARKLGPIVTRRMAEVDTELLDQLEAAGFKTWLGPDDAGLTAIATEGGAYYIDKGACALIIDGRIRIQQGEIVRFTPTGVVYSDGTEEQADIVVLCTGFTNVRESVRPILGDATTEQLATVWGIDERGEVRTSMRHSGHERLWFVANGLRIARIQSKPVALMIKAIEAGLLDPKISVEKKSPEPARS